MKIEILKRLATPHMHLKMQEWDLRDHYVFTPSIVLLEKKKILNILKFQHTFRYIVNKSIILIHYFNFIELLPEGLKVNLLCCMYHSVKSVSDWTLKMQACVADLIY